MSLTRVQEITDALSEQIGYSVAVTDYAMNLVTSSAQIGPVDEYRIAAVMQRRPPAEVIRLLGEQSVLRRTEPFMFSPESLPRNQARMCVPLVDGSSPLAFIWIILGDNRLNDDELRLLHAAAGEMLHELRAMRAHDVDELLLDSQRLQDVLSTDQLTAGYARTTLVSEGIVHPIRGAAITVFEFADERGLPQYDTQETFRPIHSRARSGWARGALLGIAYGYLVAVCPPDDVARLIADAQRELPIALPKNVRLRAAGTSSHDESAAGLRETYEEASFAVRVAAASEAVGPIADYAQLGAFIALRRLPVSEASVALLSPEAAELRGRDSRVGVETLLTFLNCAGDVHDTCARLSIHRTTLYYRLDRIRAIVGDGIDVGWRRTSIHLGLLMGELVDAA